MQDKEDRVWKTERFYPSWPMYYVVTVSEDEKSQIFPQIRSTDPKADILAVPVFREEYLAEHYRDESVPLGTIKPIENHDEWKALARLIARTTGAQFYGIDFDDETGEADPWLPFEALLVGDSTDPDSD